MNAAERDPHGDAHLRALDASVQRPCAVVEPISDDDLRAGPYPSEWSIAHVLSHLGPCAVITQRRLEDTLAGVALPGSGRW